MLGYGFGIRNTLRLDFKQFDSYKQVVIRWTFVRLEGDPRWRSTTRYIRKIEDSR